MITLIKQPVYQKDLARVINHTSRIKQLHGKSALMTGASGMIGSFLIDTLMATDEQLDIKIKVYVMGRNRQKLEKRFASHLALDTFEIVKGDVTRPLPKEIQANYLVHGASNTHPKAYVTDPIDAITTNLTGTEQALKHAVAAQPERVLFLSTVETYGEDRGNMERFTGDYCGYIGCNILKVGCPKGKRVSESLCQAYIAKHDLDVVIPGLRHTFGSTMLLSDTKASSQFILNVTE